jgi:hypothetical protein
MAAEAASGLRCGERLRYVRAGRRGLCGGRPSNNSASLHWAARQQDADLRLLFVLWVGLELAVESRPLKLDSPTRGLHRWLSGV